jgi:Holliday junction resolvase RusA-like endonuclease
MTLSDNIQVDDSRFLPWGLKLSMTFNVPQLVPTVNKAIIRRNRNGRPFIMPNDEAQAFRAHVAIAARKAVSAAHKGGPFKDVLFPIPGKLSPLRVDCYFSFGATPEGRRRLILTDIYNLAKGALDALIGIVYDDDRYITEGYTVKGLAPAEVDGTAIVGEFVSFCISRAGFRPPEHMAPLMQGALPVFPPWRPEDRSSILRPGAGKIITMPGRN